MFKVGLYRNRLHNATLPFVSLCSWPKRYMHPRIRVIYLTQRELAAYMFVVANFTGIGNLIYKYLFLMCIIEKSQGRLVE